MGDRWREEADAELRSSGDVRCHACGHDGRVISLAGSWGRRARMAAAAVSLSAAPLLFAAPAAHAAQNTDPSTTPGTINCLSWQDQAAYPSACTGLKPTLSCVWANGDGTYSAALGFTNPSAYRIEADAGSYQNSIYINGSTPTADGQPSFFRPGTSTTEFTIDWNPLRGNTVQWALDGTTLQFTSASGPACAQHPVPILASLTVIGLTGLGGVGAFVLWNRRSVNRREWLRRLVRAG
jgi:hypothetical protein